MRKVAVSACLLGYNCKYNGKNNLDPKLKELLKDCEVLPVCPEMEGGLPSPRTPCEIVGNRVLDQNGIDRTDAYEKGAAAALHRIEEKGIDTVIVQPRSPSCGKKQIYDGTFAGNLIPGSGRFAEMAAKKGLDVIEPEEISHCHGFQNVLEYRK